MTVSARNQLEGTVSQIKLGAVMAEIVVDVGGNEVVAAITKESADSLKISQGDRVRAVIKATDVMIEK